MNNAKKTSLGFLNSRTPEVIRPQQGSFGGPWRVFLSTLAIFILSQIVAALLAGFLLGVTHSFNSIDNSTAAEFIYVLLAEVGAAGLVFIVLKERRLSPAAIGLGRRPQWNDLKRAVGGFVIFYGLIIVASIIVNWLAPSVVNEQQDVGFNTITTVGDNIMAFIALVILPPLGEEVLVRGYLYSGLRASLRYLPALLITSLLFGAAHLSENDSGLLWSGALDTFLLSAVLVYLRENTGALYAGILVHMANNVIAFAVHFH